MPSISPERRQSRYEAILDAARKAFVEKGFEAVSISKIARYAGVSDGLVYHYFRDKRDLLFHVLRVFYERIMADVERKITLTSGFEAQLEALIRAHIEVFVADRDLCRLFISEIRGAPDYDGSPIQALNRKYTSTLIKIFDDGVRNGEVTSTVNPRLLRDAIFGAIEHRVWPYVNGRGHLDPKEIARDLTVMFTNGLSRRDGR